MTMVQRREPFVQSLSIDFIAAWNPPSKTCAAHGTSTTGTPQYSAISFLARRLGAARSVQ